MSQKEYRFRVEVYGNALRLVLFDLDSEVACRKVKRSEIMKEISKDASTLFKGRLQLHIEKSNVHILLKKHPVLTLHKEKFIELLSSTADVQTRAGD